MLTLRGRGVKKGLCMEELLWLQLAGGLVSLCVGLLLAKSTMCKEVAVKVQQNPAISAAERVFVEAILEAAEESALSATTNTPYHPAVQGVVDAIEALKKAKVATT